MNEPESGLTSPETGPLRQRRLSRRAVLGYSGAAGVVAGAVSAVPAVAAAPPQAGPPAPITFGATVAAENALPGTPRDQWSSGNADDLIAGYTTQYSVLPGQSVHFKVDTASADYTIRIFRLGWYGGDGARHLADVTPSVTLPQTQPGPATDAATGLNDFGTWAESASWTVPSDALSGVYYALFSAADLPRDNHTIFVVRRPGPSDILLQTSEMTMHAYSRYGGNSLYYGQPLGRAHKVSYNRPFMKSETESDFFNAEVSLVRWLERNGYDVAYCGGIDVHADATALDQCAIFISSGHDEYVSAPQRAHVTAARDAGTHLIFMTGNEYFWRVRFEPSIDGDATADRTLVCYKETLAGAKIDPTSQWTGTWRDPRFTDAPNGNLPENSLTGTLFRAILPVGQPDLTIEVPAEYAGLRFWRDTAVASLTPGQKRELSPNTLGYEFDVDADNGHRPPGLIRLSGTEATVNELLTDYGATYVPGTCTHHVTMYRATSGALVCGFGTVQWSFGLDEVHLTDEGTPVDPVMQQATVNLLADMGAQPATLQYGLVTATASTDTLPPVVTITSPVAGAEAPIGSVVTIQGTAADSGGGIVAAVEYSADAGATWHPATGRGSWSFTITPMELGGFSVLVRAVDDSCNIGQPATLALTGAARSYPCTIFADDAVPQTVAVADATALEVGVRFRSSQAGFITGVRFFKGPGNTGTHLGRVWTTTGTMLAEATFTDETPQGWQTVAIPPVAIEAETTYVASVYLPDGHYAADSGFFATDYTLAPLTAPANGDEPNGVFRIGSPGFPHNVFGAANYWVDVLFDLDNQQAPTVADHFPAAGVHAVDPAVAPRVTFSEDVVESSILMRLEGPGGDLAAVLSYDPPTRTATLTPDAPLAAGTAHTVWVDAAEDTAGEQLAGVSFGFTTAAAAGASPASLWTSADEPAVSAADASPVELGTRFRSSTAGTVTALRFHKAPGSVGPHTGHLWDASGGLLATVNFADTTRSGWQEAALAAPVELVAGQDYVVSYYCPHGHYSATSGYFSAQHSRAPLTAPATGGGLSNGVFAYGPSTFPTGSYNGGNYWADVVFVPAADLTPPSITNVEPAPGLISVARGASLRVSFDGPLDPETISASLETAGGTGIATQISYDAESAQVIMTPNSPLDHGTGYQASITAADPAGNPMSQPYTWGFTTVTAAGLTPATLWATDAVPATLASNESAAIEVGVRWRTSRDGVVTGIRFYKGPGNTGSHVGHLWRADGTLLGSATFTGQTAQGWQQASFDPPIEVGVGTDYVASYHAPAGHYSVTPGGLATRRSSDPLVAPASASATPNGVFAYGPGGFPSSSYGAGNYFVDVIFLDAMGPAVMSQEPAAGATVDSDVTLAITFNEAVVGASIGWVLKDAGGGTVPATLAYDTETMTATLTPTSPLGAGATYTSTLSAATDVAGNGLADPVSWSFATAAGDLVTLWPSTAIPATGIVNDASAVNLGVKLTTSVAGSILGVRFFKGGLANGGGHTASIYDPSGTELAQATFTGETAQGWQTVMLATPVPMTVGQTYTVAYHAPKGHYAADGGYFTAGQHTSGPLTALAASAGNGVYAYGSSPARPTNSYNGANYWVDVLFQEG
ncbi:MAG: DUF4082 domain-containing protein [Arachnia sp.]